MIALVNRPDELVGRGGVDVTAHVAAQVAGQPVLAIVGRGRKFASLPRRSLVRQSRGGPSRARGSWLCRRPLMLVLAPALPALEPLSDDAPLG